MWTDEEICRILEIFPEALESDVLVPRPYERPALRGKTSSTKSDLDKKDSTEQKHLRSTSLVDPIWETLDPTPDIRALFTQFDAEYFYGKLTSVEVRWSPRMTLCAGLCCYEGRGGLCSIRLSEPLLKLRPRSDLIETLLHEMIHAFLFVTQKDRVFHTFHREVENYQKHWWRCTGVCRNRPPFFGYVKRAMNRAPGPNDTWWDQHQALCQGTFVKIKEPEKISSSKNAKVCMNNQATTNQPSSSKAMIRKQKRSRENSTESASADIRPFLQIPSTSVPSTPSDNPHSCCSSLAKSQAESDSYRWPEFGHVLGGVREPKQSRLLFLNSNGTTNTEQTIKTSMNSDVLSTTFQSQPKFDSDSSSDSNPIPCPVCTILIPISQINEHLDHCLI
ncbi:Zinc finger RAD18 domain containing protein [Fasciolopsis buskii]|uniref:Zinc finger RAD18 domain containing protein n=1 Tax=Fasciolopsis buskii TaxID=27845 RepID=A0A8E0S483_9TREM|nr:Zinc finger RAD18 domain containing protein [Fasciolopsis buski]